MGKVYNDNAFYSAESYVVYDITCNLPRDLSQMKLLSLEKMQTGEVSDLIFSVRPLALTIPQEVPDQVPTLRVKGSSSVQLCLA